MTSEFKNIVLTASLESHYSQFFQITIRYNHILYKKVIKIYKLHKLQLQSFFISKH